MRNRNKKKCSGTISITISIVLCIQLLCVTAVNGQNIDQVFVSITVKNETLLNVFQKVEEQSFFRFMYRIEEVKQVNRLNLPLGKFSIEALLKQILANTTLTYRQVDNAILITRSEKSNPSNTLPGNDIRTPTSNITIKGRVTNILNEPLDGVSILFKGSRQVTTTNADGNYIITVPGGGALIYTYIGFTMQEIPVNNQTAIDVKMKEISFNLDEVVVTALGIKRATKSLTYGAQNVSARPLTEARELNLLTSLEGKVAGLSITSSGSGVASDVRVVLRGERSIDGDSQPLYVIDGVPVGSPATSSPDNIESITVLKGPNAAAVYGSRAQNGVIVIETKTGTADGTHLALNQTCLVQDAYQLQPYQHQYGQGNNGAYFKESESSWGPRLDGRLVDTWSLDPADAGKKYAYLPQPNNKTDIFRKGVNSVTNIIANMGSDKVQALFSYTYTYGKGILPNNDLQRHNISLRLTSKITSKLFFDSKMEYLSQAINNVTREGIANDNPMQQIYTMPPNIRTEDLLHFEFTGLNGENLQNWWNPSSSNGENPYWVLNRLIKLNTTRKAILTNSLTYNFSEALKLMVRSAFDGSNNNGEFKFYNNTFNIAAFGLYGVNSSQSASTYNDFLLSFNKSPKHNWNIKASLGGSVTNFKYSGLNSNTGLALLIPNLFSLANTRQPNTSYGPVYRSAIQSVYAFTTVSYKNAVFLDLTGRNDWSSTLPAMSRSYFYPSAGLSTVLTDLIQTYPKVISFAKLRASYATVGSSPAPYLLDRTASVGPGGNNGFLQLGGTLPSSNLRPEKTFASEIGLDIRFFNQRLGLDITAYKTNTKNQLFTIPLPVGSGASNFFTNGGDVQNSGLEIVLSANPVKHESFFWHVNLNFDRNINLVRKISDDRPKIIIGTSTDSYFKDYVIAQGEPFGQIYGRGWQRDAQNRVIVGPNGIPLFTPGRSVLLANFNPRWRGGITNTFSYKDISLSFVIDHRQGGTMVSASNAIVDALGLTERTLQGREGGLIFGTNFFGNEQAVMADGTSNKTTIKAQDFWTLVGGLNAPVGEAFVTDATSTRLRELIISYTCPGSFLNKLHLSNTTISLTGRNLCFLSRASKYADPDIMVGTDKTSEGFQGYNPPSARSYGLNLQIGF